MSNHSCTRMALVLLLVSCPLLADGFETITLGNKGGMQDGNLTAFMLKSQDAENFVLLDAGTLVNGLIVADGKQAFDTIKQPQDSPYTKVGYVLREKIKGYLISHPHLDHVAGMIIASPEDSNKTIYALPSTNQALMNNYFNWSAWPNFGDQGKGYKLNKYHYQDLNVKKWHAIPETELEVMAMPLAHSGMQSTAFILKNNQHEVFAYFGDTGPDQLEKKGAMSDVWSTLAPYVKTGKLKGIIIEVSFVNNTPDKFLFGHLTPTWLVKELKKLEMLNGKGSLNHLNVVISHIKYSLKKEENPLAIIQSELEKQNDIGVNFIYPKQGEINRF